MMASKKPDPPTISTKEVECEKTTLAEEKNSDDLRKMFTIFMEIQIHSSMEQKNVKISAQPSSQDASGDMSNSVNDIILGPVSRRGRLTDDEKVIIENTLRGLPLT